jgi:hypothetical protein
LNHRPDKHTRSHRHTISLLGPVLLALIVLGFGIRWALSAEKQVLEYDDAISLLGATGHEGEYAEIAYAGSYPLEHWTAAAEWQRMIAPEPGRGLAVVARDLALYDIHPPLYFWLLSLWVRMAGNSLAALHMFNLLLDAVIGTSLYFLGRRAWGSPLAGLLLAAVWALNPVALKTTPWIRQYILLGLAALGLAFLLYHFLTSPPHPGWKRRLSALLLIAAAGLMTHYYFALLIVVGVVLAWLLLRDRPGARRLGYGLVFSLGVAGILLLLLNPGLRTSVGTYAVHKLEPLAQPELIVPRLTAILKTNLLLFSPALLGLFLAWLGWGPSKGSAGLRRVLATLRLPSLSGWMLAFVLLSAATIAALFLTGIGPRHTMSSRYLGYLAPLVAFIPISALLSSPRRWVLPLFAAGLLVMGLAALHPDLAQAQDGSLDRERLRQAPAVLVDTLEWGTWPMAVHHLRPEQPVYIAHSSVLAYDAEPWIDGLHEGGVYVSVLRGLANPVEGRSAVLELLEERFTVQRLSRLRRPGDWEITLYQILP